MRRKSSLEHRLLALLGASTLLLLLPCGYIIHAERLDLLEGGSLLLALLLPGSWLANRIYRQTMDTLERLGLQLDALGNEEYHSWHLALYEGGRISALRQDFERLGRRLGEKRREYLHNEAFLFDFIQDLALPMLVLDSHGRVYLSNHAFSALHNLSPYALVGRQVDTLGIVFEGQGWRQLGDSALGQRHEISCHLLKRGGREYRLLVLFSIEQQLRENEKQAWQRLIRVLNHEVRNSLTPIYSMTQSLQEMKQAGPLSGEQQSLELQILKVIESRSEHLLSFVDSYGVFSSLSRARPQKMSAGELDDTLRALFPSLTVSPHGDIHFEADPGQLEQALINLLKNALESCAASAVPGEAVPGVCLRWSLAPGIAGKSQERQQIIIEIEDSGLGIANLGNLFVPFYTTKAGGTGIGLILSRELIRNQGGELTLTNRCDARGAIARVCLPGPG